MLAAFALGSGVAGLIYGARHWRAPLRCASVCRRCSSPRCIPLLLAAGNVLWLAVIAFVVGLGIAPA